MTLNNCSIFFPPFWRGQRDNNIIIIYEMKNFGELVELVICIPV